MRRRLPQRVAVGLVVAAAAAPSAALAATMAALPRALVPCLAVVALSATFAVALVGVARVRCPRRDVR